MSDDIHALSGAYAVDALDDLERAQFERHLAGCESCREEADSLREASAFLAETTLVTPPPGLRERVLADIATVRPLPPIVARPVVQSPRDRKMTPRASRVRRFPALVAAAAAVVAVGVGGAVVVQPWDDAPGQTVPSAVDRIKAAEDVQSWTRELQAGAKVTLYRSASLNRAIIVTDDMGPAPDGKVYQAWLQHEETMVSAGVMPEGPDNVVVLEGEAATANGFGLTVEPAGGSVVPTKEPVAYIPFETT